MLYAASPRQQIDKLRDHALVSSLTAWVSTVIINVLSFFWLVSNGWSILVAGIDLLLINTLMIPAVVIFIAHKPQWLKAATIVIIIFSFLSQYAVKLVVQGQYNVA